MNATPRSKYNNRSSSNNNSIFLVRSYIYISQNFVFEIISILSILLISRKNQNNRIVFLQTEKNDTILLTFLDSKQFQRYIVTIIFPGFLIRGRFPVVFGTTATAATTTAPEFLRPL